MARELAALLATRKLDALDHGGLLPPPGLGELDESPASGFSSTERELRFLPCHVRVVPAEALRAIVVRRRTGDDNGGVVLVSEPLPFWTMVARFRQFEGWRCLWRLPVAALAYAIVPLTFIGATVLAAYIAGDNFGLATAIVSAAVVGVATALLVPRLARWQLHRKIIANRFWTFEKPNPATEVPTLLRSPDVVAARAALCRARFNPLVCSVSVGSPPSDAPDLDVKVAVHEPQAWTQSASDDDRTRRMVGVLERAGIRAHVGGVDTNV